MFGKIWKLSMPQDSIRPGLSPARMIAELRVPPTGRGSPLRVTRSMGYIYSGE